MKGFLPDIPTTAKDRIIRYLVEQDITLTSDEERILSRIETVDKLIQAKVPYKQIVEELSNTHNVSRFTAYNDVFLAQQIFGAARGIDKRYLMFLKYLRQEEDIEKVRVLMFQKRVIKEKNENGEEVVREEEPDIDAKMLAALAKLEEASTYTLNSMPDNAPAHMVKAPMIFIGSINNTVNNVSQEPNDINELLAKADEFINVKPNDSNG